jgi:hypothetical protein
LALLSRYIWPPPESENSGSWTATLLSVPIINDEVRLLSYLKNCLEMEGFYSTDIELIMGWLYEKIA